MKKIENNEKYIAIVILFACMVIIIAASCKNDYEKEANVEPENYIKWVDFNVSYEALCKAYEWDVKTYNSSEEKAHVNWIELLAYIGAVNGGSFGTGCLGQIDKAAEKLNTKETTIKDLTKNVKCYDYYLEAYTAILGGFIGEYTEVTYDGITKDGKKKEKKYRLKAFSPIAKGFEYSDYDDFGASRSYGYKKEHLEHDMMGQIGTPIIAVESGYVEAIGWNQYGGWRIGIRSFDKKRYYYYAHLRQNFPYPKDLEEGDIVTAGDVIGYMGHTGYSTKENTNNIDSVHLHFGSQLIFNECQKECNSEIWINPYNIVRFLYKNRCETQKVEETKEWKRINKIILPEVEDAVQASKSFQIPLQGNKKVLFST